MEKIKNFLLYNGLSKENFKKIEGNVCEGNRRIGIIFFPCTALVFLAIAFTTLFSGLEVKVMYHLVPAIVFTIAWLVNSLLGKKYPKLTMVCSITYPTMILFTGIILGISQNTERTTLLLPMFIIASLVFAFKNCYIFIYTIIAEVAYLILASLTQSPELFFMNAVNTIVMSLTGIFTGCLMMVIKYKMYYSDYYNKFLSERDSLTSLYNRRRFDKDVEELISNRTKFIIFNFDVNGLKKCNDEKGHEAGDELIIASATCIKNTFKPYGKIYRIGGDEFIALLFKDGIPSVNELENRFNQEINNYHGVLIDHFSVSCGHSIYEGSGEVNFNLLYNQADEMMYNRKREFHEREK